MTAAGPGRRTRGLLRPHIGGANGHNNRLPGRMSAGAEAHVWERSPYKGATFACHLAIGDVVNDMNNNEFWLPQPVLARKARCSPRSALTALETLEGDGWIERLDEQHGPERGTTYRFLFRDDAPKVFNMRGRQRKPGDNGPTLATGARVPPANPRNPRSQPSQSSHEPSQSSQSAPLIGLTQEPNRTQPRVIDDLCAALSQRIGLYAGDPKKAPAITERWRKDTRLLLERGPLGRAKPETLSAERVEHCIAFVFDELADPGRDGFCWAAQIRSPHALREHWDQLLDAAKRKRARSNGSATGHPQQAGFDLLFGKLKEHHASA